MDTSERSRRVAAGGFAPGVAMTIAASLVLPIPLLAAFNKYAVQYPLDRLHYAMFQVLLAVLVPVVAVLLRWPGSGYRLEFAHYTSPQQPPEARKEAEQSTAASHAGGAHICADGAHRYAEQCAAIERAFMALAAGDDSKAGSSPWRLLTSQRQPYPISVEGHVDKPFCFRVVFYAPTLAGTAFDLLASILRRPEWDELTESTRIVESLAHRDAIHYVKMKPVWPTAARDSLLLSHLAAVQTADGSRGYLNVSRSIEDVRVPESGGGVVRMEAGIAGQLVTRVPPAEAQALALAGDRWCKVVQIADGDLKGWIPKSVIKFIATQALPRSLAKVCRQLAALPPSAESRLLQPPEEMLAPSETLGEMLAPPETPEIPPPAVLATPAAPQRYLARRPTAPRWKAWLRVLLRYAGPAVVAAVTSLVFQLIVGRRMGRSRTR